MTFFNGKILINISKNNFSLLIFIAFLFYPIIAISDSSFQESAKNFSLSLKANNQATILQNSNGSLSEIMKYRKKALDYANKTKQNDLNKRLPGLGDKYFMLFRNGLEFQIEGYLSEDNNKLLKGQLLVSQRGQWFTANIDKIRKNK